MKDAVLVEGWQCRGRWTMVAPRHPGGRGLVECRDATMWPSATVTPPSCKRLTRLSPVWLLADMPIYNRLWFE